MATNAQWTIVFEDKMIIKNYAEGASEGVGYVIDDNDFWGQSKFSNVWAVQYATSNVNDQVEKNFSIATDNLFSYISKFKTVNTNHLHVGIAAALIGKTVNLYRGSYHKISGVYDFSIVNKYKKLFL